MSERQELRDWIAAEQLYSDAKFGDQREQHQAALREEGPSLDGRWMSDVLMYVHRATVLGLDNPLGRQALAKGYAVYTNMLEAMLREYGTLPAAGLPSGELK